LTFPPSAADWRFGDGKSTPLSATVSQCKPSEKESIRGALQRLKK